MRHTHTRCVYNLVSRHTYTHTHIHTHTSDSLLTNFCVNQWQINDGTTRAICGIPIPDVSTISSADDETVSTALGHTCHLVSLMANYSLVHLQYMPVPFASRSVMRDVSAVVTRTNVKDGVYVCVCVYCVCVHVCICMYVYLSRGAL